MTYKPNAHGSDACRGSNSLWTRTLDRYTRAGLPECEVSTMSGTPSKATQDRTQTKDTHPIPGQKLKFLTLPGIEPRPLGWKAGTLPTMPRRRISTNVNKKTPYGLKVLFLQTFPFCLDLYRMSFKSTNIYL